MKALDRLIIELEKIENTDIKDMYSKIHEIKWIAKNIKYIKKKKYDDFEAIEIAKQQLIMIEKLKKIFQKIESISLINDYNNYKLSFKTAYTESYNAYTTYNVVESLINDSFDNICENIQKISTIYFLKKNLNSFCLNFEYDINYAIQQYEYSIVYKNNYEKLKYSSEVRYFKCIADEFFKSLKYNISNTKYILEKSNDDKIKENDIILVKSDYIMYNAIHDSLKSIKSLLDTSHNNDFIIPKLKKEAYFSNYIVSIYNKIHENNLLYMNLLYD